MGQAILGVTMIDWERIRELRDDMGDAFDEVVAVFMDELGEVIDRLENDPMPASFEQDFHFLKGAALNLGFDAFAARCARAETMVQTGDQPDLAAVLATYHQSRQVFLDGLGKLAA